MKKISYVLIILTFGCMASLLLSCTNRASAHNPNNANNANDLKKDRVLTPPQGNPSQPGEADIDFDTRLVNLGSVDPGGRKEQMIKVYNRGTKDLVISQVKSSCGCTAVWPLKNNGLIKPKEYQELMITLESKDGKSIPARSRITFHSNDPAEPTCYIETQVEIKTYFSVEPKSVNLGQIVQGEETSSRVVIASLEKTPIKIKNIISQDAQITANVVENVLLPNNIPGVALDIVFNSKNRPLGNVRGLVELELEHAKQNKVFVSVFGIIGGEVLLQSGTRFLNIPLYDVGSLPYHSGPVLLPDARKLKLVLHEKSKFGPLKVLQVIGEQGPIRLEPKDLVPGKEIELTIVNDKKFRSGFFRQRFKVLLNHPEMPFCEVFLQGTIQSNISLSTEGVYVSTLANTPFERKIFVQNIKTPQIAPDLEIRGGQFLQYELVPEKQGVFLLVKSAGCSNSFLEEIELIDKNNGEVVPITAWVEILAE